MEGGSQGNSDQPSLSPRPRAQCQWPGNRLYAWAPGGLCRSNPRFRHAQLDLGSLLARGSTTRHPQQGIESTTSRHRRTAAAFSPRYVSDACQVFYTCTIFRAINSPGCTDNSSLGLSSRLMSPALERPSNSGWLRDRHGRRSCPAKARNRHIATALHNPSRIATLYLAPALHHAPCTSHLAAQLNLQSMEHALYSAWSMSCCHNKKACWPLTYTKSHAPKPGPTPSKAGPVSMAVLSYLWKCQDCRGHDRAPGHWGSLVLSTKCLSHLTVSSVRVRLTTSPRIAA